MRVVVDTNVLIAALISSGGPPARLIDAWLEGRFELATGSAQLEELARVTRYPKIRRRIERFEAGWLVNKLRSIAVLVRPARVSASTDPDDDVLLGIAVAADAEYLVSGDKSGLLSLRRLGRVQIVSARKLCEVLKLK